MDPLIEKLKEGIINSSKSPEDFERFVNEDLSDAFKMEIASMSLLDLLGRVKILDVIQIRQALKEKE